jgi:hypothetical protein
VELIVSLGLFTLLSVALALALKQSSMVWNSSSSHRDATQRLRQVATELERSIPMASVQNLDTTPVPASLPSGGYDGDAIWFLSHINPYDGKAYVKSDGTPFWQCNVLYYSVTPRDVDRIAGTQVPSGVNPDGYEDRCSYKVLLRKTIDLNGPSDLTDEDTSERLLVNPARFLTRPVKYDTSHMVGENDLISTELVATELLLFRASPQSSPDGVQFDIRAVSQEEAQRVARATSNSMLESPLTSQSLLFVTAHN